MSTGPHDDCPSRERLSALADGETGGGASAAACATWHAEDDARRDWHCWQLIGDVLRSDELASSAARDARFLAVVRARLAVEAVVLAPAPQVAAALSGVQRPARWPVPAAMAAGFVLVVGTFAVLRPDQPASPAAATAADGPLRSDAPVALAGAGASQQVRASEAVATDPKVIRDARLDRYLAAHKQFAGSTALGVPSAFLRSATVESASR